MTDVAQRGPSWWLASDGRWYPPHLHPSCRTATASPNDSWWLASDGRWYPPEARPGSSAAQVAHEEVPSTPADPTISQVEGFPLALGGQGAKHPAQRRRKKTRGRDALIVLGLLVVILAASYGIAQWKLSNAHGPTTEAPSPTSRVASDLTVTIDRITHEMATGQADAALPGATVLHPPSSFERWRTMVEAQRGATLKSTYHNAQAQFAAANRTPPAALAHWYRDATAALGDVGLWQLAETGFLVAQKYGDTASERSTVASDLSAYEAAIARTKADVQGLG